MITRAGAVGLLAVLVVAGPLACGKGGTDRAAQAQRPETLLDGSWFVRYRTIETPFLDVAFAGSEQPLKVQAGLSGPEERFESLELSWNPKDSEWQHPIEWLPNPLPSGLWWVHSVRAELRSGRVIDYRSSHPATPYSLRRSESATLPLGAAVATEVLPGAFTARPVSGPLLHIEVAPVGSAQGADPILHVFEPGESETWFAVNDDWEVDSKYPALALEPGARKELLVRVSGYGEEQGAYRLTVHRGPRPATYVMEGGAEKDLFEADDEPARARAIRPGEGRIRRIDGGAEEGDDVDWFRVVLGDG